MTQENITYLLDAEDKATKKVRAVTQDIEKQVKHVKDVGGKAKASTELVGTMSSVLGNAGLGSFAGELAQVTERISAFSEVANAGASGALAFKAGIAGVAAVGLFTVGKAFVDSTYHARQLNEEIERATRLTLEFQKVATRRDSFEQFKISLAEGPEQQADLITRELERIAKLQEDQRNKIDNAVEKLAGERANRSALLGRLAPFVSDTTEMNEATEAIKQFRGELTRLNDLQASQEGALKRLDFSTPLKAERDATKKATEAKAQQVAESKKYLDTLREELDLLVMSKTERRNHEANKNTVGADTGRAKKLLAERDAFLEFAKKKKEAEAESKKRIAEQVRESERLANLQQSTLQSFQLQTTELTKGKEAAAALSFQFKGLDTGTASFFAGIQSKLAEATGGTSGTTSALRGTDNRFGSGRAERNARLRDRNDAVQVAKQSQKVLEEIKDEMIAFNKNKPVEPIQIVQRGS